MILSIVDVDGEPYFSLQSTELMDNSIKLVDNKGKTVASCRKERFGPGKIVNICVKNGEDDIPEYTFITQYLNIPGWTKKTEGMEGSIAVIYHSLYKFNLYFLKSIINLYFKLKSILKSIITKMFR